MKTKTHQFFSVKLPRLMLLSCSLLALRMNAQDAADEGTPTTSHKLVIAGSGSAMFTSFKFTGGESGNTFAPMDLMLMPIAKMGDRVFLESGVKMEMNESNDGFEFGLEALTLHYRLTPWMSAFGGKFAAKYGNYLDMLGEGFVSRFPTDAVGLADAGLGPTDQVGFGVQGGFQCGYSRIVYCSYLSNGPQLMVDSLTPGGDNMTGHLSYETLLDNNRNKSMGWTVGILPFPNSSLQLDFSGQTTAKTGDEGSEFENVSSNSYAGDLNFVQLFNPIMVRVMGQYEMTTTANRNYSVLADTSFLPYTFDNKGNSWYGAATLRGSGLHNEFLARFEAGVRFAGYNPPVDALWGGDPVTQTSACLTYWLRWDCPLNFAYDIIKSGDETQNMFTIRSVYRF